MSDQHPEVLAIIPARGGSKGIPRKNVRPLAGKPLLAYSIEDALAADHVTRVVVSTDDAAIAEVARTYGAEVVHRPAEIAGDTATSESALVHVLDALAEAEGYTPDLIVFLQATSPIRQPGDVDRAIETLRAEGADSLLSVKPFHGFTWVRQGAEVRSLDYDYRHRPRRQDRPPEFQENGSIYVFKPWVLREHDNRLGGKIALYVMDYWSSFEIDDPEDFALVEWIVTRRQRQREAAALPDPVALIAFDFDGVFTDNRVLVREDGMEAVTADRGDGMGVEMLRKAGVPMVVISREINPVVRARCDKMKLEAHHGITDKVTLLRDYMAERGIDPAHAIFVGNDVNDLGCMGLVGCAAAPADAHPAALAAADLVLHRPGGRGAVRELADLILERLSER